MSIIPKIPTTSEPPHVTDARHAQALSEIQKMREDYSRMHNQLAQAEREIMRLQNQNDILREDKEHYRQHAMVFQRKLLRLAAAMSGVSRLCADADAIMKDATEFEEARASEQPQPETNHAPNTEEIVGLLRDAARS